MTVPKTWRNIEGGGTVDRGAQEEKLRQLVKYVYERAYSLVIYSPISLYALNKEVDFVPRYIGGLILKDSSVTDNHWSVRGKRGPDEE